MNVLSDEKRLNVLNCLVNGTSERAAERICSVQQKTIGRFRVQVGTGCQRLHDRLVRDLSCSLVDMDEQHSWVGKKRKNIDPKKDDTSIMGVQWTWAALCRSSALVISWVIGRRDQVHANALVADTRARLVVMPQITTDGLKLYEKSILASFGPGVDYAMTIKRSRDRNERDENDDLYAVPKGEDFLEKRSIYGAPDLDLATTYAIERNNLTTRQWCTRLQRRTLSFSKRFERHCAALALHYTHYNFCHILRNMRVTPAMAAGVTDHVWMLDEFMSTVLAEPAGERPQPKPLAPRVPTTTSRPLPNGQGHLRVVPGKSRSARPPQKQQLELLPRVWLVSQSSSKTPEDDKDPPKEPPKKK